MPYYNKSTRDVAAAVGLGLRVDRAAQALVNGNYDIFDIYGMVLMTLLVGECTVATGGANTATLTFTPTTGTAALLAVATDLNGWVQGDICHVDGLIGSNILPAAHASKSSAAFYSTILNGNGVINLATTAAAGTFAWSIWYVPLEAGAYIAVSA
jgi:hypothetical protein